MKKTASKQTPTSLRKLQQQQDRTQLQNLLFERTEDKVLQDLSDRRLDREYEKITLLSGAEISLFEIRRIRQLIADELQGHGRTFRNEYFENIYRLFGWQIPSGGIQMKDRPIIALYTNAIIYARFPKNVLPMLQHLNVVGAMGIREHKHYQWLTPEGRAEVLKFIDEAVEMMTACTTWYEFRIKYSKKYRLSFQLRLDL